MCSIAIYASFIFPGKKGAGRLLFLFPFLDGFIRQGVLGAGARAVGTGGTVLSRAGGVAGFLLTPLERRGTGACPAGAPFLGKKWGKNPRGRRFLPGTPSGGVVWGEAVLLSWYLACGLQDQRLMARPPARAGGRSGSLTGGKSGNPQVYSLPSPKGYPSTSPARPAGGRAVTGPFNVKAAGQVRR